MMMICVYVCNMACHHSPTYPNTKQTERPLSWPMCHSTLQMKGTMEAQFQQLPPSESRMPRDDASQVNKLTQPVHECMVIYRKIHNKLSQCTLVRRTPKRPILLQATGSPASYCVALMTSCRLILCAKKIKCFKDDSQWWQWTTDIDSEPEVAIRAWVNMVCNYFGNIPLVHVVVINSCNLHWWCFLFSHWHKHCTCTRATCIVWWCFIKTYQDQNTTSTVEE